MLKPNSWKRRALAGVLAAVVLACGLLGACAQGSGQARNQAADQQSADAENESAQDATEAVTLSVQMDSALALPLQELEDAYAQEHANVQFENADTSSEGDTAEEVSAASDVIALGSKTAMDEAEAVSTIDATTRFDLAADDLVIVCASGADLKSLGLEELADGSYAVAVADPSSMTGALTAQALSSVGVYVPGSAADQASASTEEGETEESAAEIAENETSEADVADASAEKAAGQPIADAVQVESSTDEVCEAVSAGTVQVGIVRATDVYRVGGVRVVGTVPASSYVRIVYPVAVGASAAHASEAEAFLEWCANDSDALDIAKKWGLSSVL